MVEGLVSELLSGERSYLSELQSINDSFASELGVLCASTATIQNADASAESLTAPVAFASYVRDIAALTMEVRVFFDELVVASQTDGGIAESFCRYSSLLHAHLRYARAAVDVRAALHQLAPEVVIKFQVQTGLGTRSRNLRTTSVRSSSNGNTVATPTLTEEENLNTDFLLPLDQIVNRPVDRVMEYMDWLRDYKNALPSESEEAVYATRALGGVEFAARMLADTDTTGDLVAAAKHLNLRIANKSDETGSLELQQQQQPPHLLFRSSNISNSYSSLVTGMPTCSLVELDVQGSSSSSTSSSTSSTSSIVAPSTPAVVYLFSTFILVGVLQEASKTPFRPAFACRAIIPLHHTCSVQQSKHKSGGKQFLNHITIQSPGVNGLEGLDTMLKALFSDGPEGSAIGEPVIINASSSFVLRLSFVSAQDATYWFEDSQTCVAEQKPTYAVVRRISTRRRLNAATLKLLRPGPPTPAMLQQQQAMAAIALSETDLKNTTSSSLMDSLGDHIADQKHLASSISNHNISHNTSTKFESEAIPKTLDYRGNNSVQANSAAIYESTAANMASSSEARSSPSRSMSGESLRTCTDFAQLVREALDSSESDDHRGEAQKPWRTAAGFPSVMIEFESCSSSSPLAAEADATAAAKATTSSFATYSRPRTMWEDMPMSLFVGQLLQPMSAPARFTVPSRSSQAAKINTPSGRWIRSVEPGAAAERLCMGGGRGGYEQCESMLRIYAEYGQPAAAMAFAAHCRSYGIEPTGTTFALIAKAMLTAGQIGVLLDFHSCVPADLRAGDLNNVVLEAFAIHGMAERATEFIREMKAAGMKVHTKHYAYLVKAFGNAGDLSSALDTVRDLAREALHARTSIGHKSSEALAAVPDTLLVDALIQAAGQCGDPHVARAIFEMVLRGDPGHAHAVGTSLDGSSRSSPGDAASISAAAANLLTSAGTSSKKNELGRNANNNLPGFFATSSSGLSDTGIGSLSYLGTGLGTLTSAISGVNNPPSPSKRGANLALLATNADLQQANLYELFDAIKQASFAGQSGASLLSAAPSTYESLACAYSLAGMSQQAEAILDVLSVRCEIEKKRQAGDFQASNNASALAWNMSSAGFEGLLELVAKQGDVEYALTLLERMETLKVSLSPSVASSILSSLRISGFRRAACDVFASLQDSNMADHPSLFPALLEATSHFGSVPTSTPPSAAMAILKDSVNSVVPLQLNCRIYEHLLPSGTSSQVADPSVFVRLFDALQAARISPDSAFLLKAFKSIRKFCLGRSSAVVAVRRLLRLDELGLARAGACACAVATVCSTIGMLDAGEAFLQVAAKSPGCPPDALATATSSFLTASFVEKKPVAVGWMETVHALLSTTPITECLRFCSVQATEALHILPSDREWLVAQGIEACTPQQKPFVGNRLSLFSYIPIGTRRKRQAGVVMAQFSQCFAVAIRSAHGMEATVDAFGAYSRFLTWYVAAFTDWMSTIRDDMSILFQSPVSSISSPLPLPSTCASGAYIDTTSPWNATHELKREILLEICEGLAAPWLALLEAVLLSCSERAEARVALHDGTGYLVELGDSPSDVALRIFELMAHDNVVPTPKLLQAACTACIKHGLGHSVERLMHKSVSCARQVFFQQHSQSSPSSSSVPNPVSTWMVCDGLTDTYFAYLQASLLSSHSLTAIRFAAAGQARLGVYLEPIWSDYQRACLESAKDIRDCAAGIIANNMSNRSFLTTLDLENLKVAEAILASDPEGRGLMHHDVLVAYLEALASATASCSISDVLSVESIEAGGESLLLPPEVACALARAAVVDCAAGGRAPSVHIHAALANVYARAGLMSDARLLLRILLSPVSGEDYTQASLQHDSASDLSRLNLELMNRLIPENRGGRFLYSRVAATDVSLLALGINAGGHAYGGLLANASSSPIASGGKGDANETNVPVSSSAEAYGLAQQLKQKGDVESFAHLLLDSSSYCTLVLALGAAGLADGIRQIVDFAADSSGCLDLIASICTYAAYAETGSVEAADAVLTDARFDFKTISASHGQSVHNPLMAEDAFKSIWERSATVLGGSWKAASFSRGLAASFNNNAENAVPLLHTLRIMAHCHSGYIHSAFRLLEVFLAEVMDKKQHNTIDNNQKTNKTYPTQPFMGVLLPEAVTAALHALGRLSTEELTRSPTDDVPISAAVLPYVRANELLNSALGANASVSSLSATSATNAVAALLSGGGNTRVSDASIVDRLNTVSQQLQELGWEPTSADISALIRLFAAAGKPLSALLLGWTVIQHATLSRRGNGIGAANMALSSMILSSPTSSNILAFRPGAGAGAGVAETVAPLRHADVDVILKSLLDGTTEFQLSETGAAAATIVKSWISSPVQPTNREGQPASSSPTRVRHPDPEDSSTTSGINFTGRNGQSYSTSTAAPTGVYHPRTLLAQPDILVALLWVYATAPRQLYEAGAVSAGALEVLRSVAKYLDLGLGATAEALMGQTFARLRVAGARSGTSLSSSSISTITSESDAVAEISAFIATASEAYDARPLGTDVGSIHHLLSSHGACSWLPVVSPVTPSRVPLYPTSSSASILLQSESVPLAAITVFDQGAAPVRALVSLLGSVGYASAPHVVACRQPQVLVQYSHSLAAGLRGIPRRPTPLDVADFFANAQLIRVRLTGQVYIPTASSSSASITAVVNSSRQSMRTLAGMTEGGAKSSASRFSNTVDSRAELDDDTSRIEAEVLVLQIELDELAAATAHAEAELSARRASNPLFMLEDIASRSNFAISMDGGRDQDAKIDAISAATTASHHHQQQQVSKLRHEASVFRSALGLLTEEEEELSHHIGLNPQARGILGSHQLAERQTLHAQANESTTCIEGSEKIASYETSVLHALSGVITSKRLPAAAAAAPGLVSAQTTRLAVAAKARAIEEDTVRGNSQTAPLVTAEVFARQKARANERTVENVQNLAKQLAGAEDDLMALQLQENKVRNWIASLGDLLRFREAEGEAVTAQPFAGAIAHVERARMQLEAAKARHAIDRRLAVAGRMEEAVADVRSEGERTLAEVRAKYAKDAEGWTLEYRRKCDAAQEQLRAALEAELSPVASIAEAEARAAADRKATVRRELVTCDEALSSLTRENASLAHAVDETLSSVVLLSASSSGTGGPTNNLMKTFANNALTTATRDDLRQAVAAAAGGDETAEQDIVLRVLDDLERHVEADPLQLAREFEGSEGGPRNYRKVKAGLAAALEIHDSLPANCLMDLISLYEEECRRRNLTGVLSTSSTGEHSALGDILVNSSTLFSTTPHAAATTSSSSPMSLNNITPRTRTRPPSIPVSVAAGPAGAKHSFSLLPSPPTAEGAARKTAESDADAARIRERVLRKLVPTTSTVAAAK